MSKIPAPRASKIPPAAPASKAPPPRPANNDSPPPPLSSQMEPSGLRQSASSTPQAQGVAGGTTTGLEEFQDDSDSEDEFVSLSGLPIEKQPRRMKDVGSPKPPPKSYRIVGHDEQPPTEFSKKSAYAEMAKEKTVADVFHISTYEPKDDAGLRRMRSQFVLQQTRNKMYQDEGIVPRLVVEPVTGMLLPRDQIVTIGKNGRSGGGGGGAGLGSNASVVSGGAPSFGTHNYYSPQQMGSAQQLGRSTSSMHIGNESFVGGGRSTTSPVDYVLPPHLQQQQQQQQQQQYHPEDQEPPEEEEEDVTVHYKRSVDIVNALRERRLLRSLETGGF